MPKIRRNEDSSRVQSIAQIVLTLCRGGEELTIADASVSKSFAGRAVRRPAGNRFRRAFPAITAVIVVVVLVVGWLESGEEYLTPDSGTGYWLGIYGSAAMLSLLVYSYRKRYKSARVIGSIPFWFRAHMILGIVGPVVILFHANFKLGPLNSNVALFSMLIVAVSGVIGKYIYGKIHMGLHGRKARVRELLVDAEELKRYLGEDMKVGAFVSRELNEFTASIEKEARASVLGSLWGGAVMAVRARRMRARLIAEARRLIRIEGKTAGWSRQLRRDRQKRVTEIVSLYSEAVLKAAQLAFYDRLFALWHVLHLPLFFLMLAAGLIHVWAVHQY
jgi:hypothetical protein